MSHSSPLQHAAAAARAGNQAVAKVHLQKAAEADPDNPAVWLWMGWLSDSPTSMIQCLEMLLSEEDYRDAAEAGIQFAQTLANFRAGQPVRSPAEAQRGTATSAPSHHTPQSESIPGTSTEPQPDGRNAPESVASRHPEFAACETVQPDVPARDELKEIETVDDAPASRRVVPEIIFEHDVEESAVGSSEHPADATHAESVIHEPPTPDGASLSDDERQMWASFWEPGLDVEEMAPDHAVEAEPSAISDARVATEQTPDALAVSQVVAPMPVPEPVVISPPPPEMFRPARADWFSPDGAVSQPVADPAVSQSPAAATYSPPESFPASAPGQPQWARPASAFDVQVAPVPQQVASPAQQSSTVSGHGASVASAYDAVRNLPAPESTSVWRQPSAPQTQPQWQQPTTAPGTEVSVTAPGRHAPHEVSVATAPADELADCVDAPASPDTTNHTVLVVDDSPTVRKLVAMTLEKRGYRVVTAFDGVAAIKEIAAQNPGLVLMDCNMPRLDGYQLCKLVKKHDSTRHIPVVMLSGKDGVFDRLRGRLVGCAGYIPKPFVPEALAEAVAQYLPPPTE